MSQSPGAGSRGMVVYERRPSRRHEAPAVTAGPVHHRRYGHAPIDRNAPFIDEFVYLSNLLNVYDWNDNDGYSNFGNWVEKAAKQAQT